MHEPKFKIKGFFVLFYVITGITNLELLVVEEALLPQHGIVSDVSSVGIHANSELYSHAAFRLV